MANNLDLVDLLRSCGAALNYPSTDIDYHMQSTGVPKVPADYAAFLKEANGAQCLAFVLYGTDPQMAAGGSEFESFVDATDRIYADKWDGSYVLGHVVGSGMLLLFDATKQEYRVIDGTDPHGDVLYSYPTIADFALDWLRRKKLIPAEQD